MGPILVRGLDKALVLTGQGFWTRTCCRSHQRLCSTALRGLLSRFTNCPPPGRRVDFLEAGISRFLGNPDFWDLEIQTFGIQNIEKIQILKIQIRSAQNVGKVWISRGEKILALFGAI